MTYIREGAFQNCSNLASITIPNSVTYVGKDAFKETAWYNNQDGLVYIGSIAYEYKGTMPEDTEIVIREGTTRIGEGAFSGCSSLKSIHIPNSITIMEEKSFSGCSSLTSVYISDLVAWCNIVFRPHDVSGFDYCASNPLLYAQHLYLNGNEVKDMIIPDGVTAINGWAFYGFSGLTSVTIPNSVTEIGFRAFERCSNIISMDIPSTVTSIGKDAFAGTPWFENYKGLMYLGSMAYKYKGEMPENTEIVIREGTTEISNNAFMDCSGLKSIHIPNSVTSIGWYAFQGCTGLTAVHISDIAAWFNIQFGSNPLTYAHHLYIDGKEITELTIPDNVTTVGSAISGCSSLTSITIPNSVTSIGSSAFSGCSGLTSINIPNSVTSIDNYAFENCSGLTSIIIPNSVMSIGSSAFSGCSSLTSVTIPNNVTNIGGSAFQGCSSLTSVTIPNNVTSIGGDTFNGCSAMKSIIIPNSVTSIGYSAFRGCSSLFSVTIPNNVTSIGGSAFYDCDNLKFVAFTSDKFTGYKQLGNVNAQVIMPLSVYDKGIPNNITKFATYSSIPVYVEVKSIGAVSAVLNLYPIDKDGNIDEEEMTTVTSVGHKPGEQLGWKLNDENYGILNDKTNETIALTVQEPKALSIIKARLLATTEEADDFEHYGFEWRQQDAPEGRPSNNVSAPLYNGHIVGTLNNLNPDKDYKYRPFYKADDGTMFYGDWVWLYTGDANVAFEPEVYTKDAADITKVSALLAGVWFEGTDDFQEKGFEYWTVSGSKTRGVGSDVKKVVVSGNAMTATLEGLKAGATYGYRSYVKTTSGSTTYGEEKTFQTILIGDVDGDGKLTNADADAIAKHIMGQTPTGFKKKMADVNEDGYVNVADIVLLVNMIEK